MKATDMLTMDEKEEIKKDAILLMHAMKVMGPPPELGACQRALEMATNVIAGLLVMADPELDEAAGAQLGNVTGESDVVH